MTHMSGKVHLLSTAVGLVMAGSRGNPHRRAASVVAMACALAVGVGIGVRHAATAACPARRRRSDVGRRSAD